MLSPVDLIAELIKLALGLAGVCLVSYIFFILPWHVWLFIKKFLLNEG